MKQYNVYEHPVEGVVAIKNGWSWPGFFFGMWWALFKKLWGVAAAIFGVVVLLAFFPPEIGSGASFGIAAVMGVYGNSFRENKCQKQGYKLVSTHQAKTDKAALAKAC